MFQCSICAESSETICVYCTKDACANHLCDRCHRCSDCCDCEITVRVENGHTIHVHELPDQLTLVAEAGGEPLAGAEIVEVAEREPEVEMVQVNLNGAGHAPGEN